MKLPCPACGADLDFRSRTAVFAVCSYCSTSVLRGGSHLENLGKMAELLPDMSPLQLGTRGNYLGDRFELVGRLKLLWEDGSWNEWFALFDDGREGWLAEAQGFWMMCFPLEDAERHLPSRFSPGMVVHFGESSSMKFREDVPRYRVDDIRSAVCSGSEGQLPFAAPKGRECRVIDLSGIGHDGFASIEVSDQDGTRVHMGTYIELAALEPENLRVLDGW